MIDQLLAPSGCAPDVTWRQDGWWVAYGAPGAVNTLRLVTVDREGHRLAEREIAAGLNTLLAFPRLCGPWLAYRADDTTARLYNLETAREAILGPCAGNDPVALSGEYVAWQTPDWRVVRRALDGLDVVDVREGAPPGLSHIDAAGRVWLIDEVRFGHRTPEGRLIFDDVLRDVAGTRPAWADALVACEAPEAGIILHDLIAVREVRLWPSHVSYPPHVAIGPPGLAAVVTWSGPGVRLALVDLVTDLAAYVAPPPLRPPTVRSLTVTPPGGAAPLTVTATVALDDAITWRWLLDGVIHPPHDGLTHTFPELREGTHTIGLRIAGGVAEPVTPAPCVVTVDPPPAPPQDPIPGFREGFRGVHTGFGEVRGAALYAALRARGAELARIEAAHDSDADLTAAIVQEVLDAGLRPLTICRTLADLAAVPAWTDVEWQNEPDGQVWPGRHFSPAHYIASLPEVLTLCAERHLRLWVPSIGTIARDPLAWLAAVLPAVPETVGISAHCYPQANLHFEAAPPGFATRWAAVLAFKALIAPRPFLISECGYHQSARGVTWRWLRWLLQLLGLYSPPLTHEAIADRIRREVALWRTAGADAWVWYQVDDAQTGLRYGLRDAQGVWKVPQSDIATWDDEVMG